MPTLHDPITVGDWTLPNRIVMAPLTRCRAGPGRVPTALMAEYYRQRAGAGLIISEAVAVTPMGVGYPDTPGLWSEAQVEGWRQVTAAVHLAGGRIIAQLWHVGRISDPIYLDGALPVAPSAIAPGGHVSLVRPIKAFVTPRALAAAEIPGIIEAYRQAAVNAKAAGFDGVELHGANGYLLDQFLQDSTNKRSDEWGGPVGNRARLMLAAVDAAISVWGAGRVGLHLAPQGDSHDMGDSDKLATFSHVAREAGRRRLAFLFVREGLVPGRVGPQLKRAFGGVYIANQGLDLGSAQGLLDAGDADAVAFGKPYIANPDLALRLVRRAPLNQPDQSTFYGQGAKGYTDYATLAS